MRVVEKFVSINGESTKAGELAVFIRFKGCNLNCTYCDTKWANTSYCEYEELTPEQIVDYIRSTGVKNVTLTGGEPLLQKDIDILIEKILEQPNLSVEIETNGAVSISAFCKKARPIFTMDYKLPSSGFEDKMLIENFNYLLPNDTIKFVIGSDIDLKRVVEVIRQYNLCQKCHIYFSPVFGSIEPAKIVEYMIENKLNDIRLQIQIHKVIWGPQKRGV